MNKKIISFVSASSLISLAFLSASCGIKQISEQPIKVVQKQKEVNTLIDTDAFLKIIFKNKSEEEINTFKLTQSVDDSWLDDLNSKIKKANALLQLENRSSEEEISLQRYNHEISAQLSQKWYWYLNNISKFTWKYSNLVEDFNKSIINKNGSFEEDYLNNLKIFKHDPYSFIKNTYKPANKKIKGIEIVDDVDSDGSGSYYVHINDYFFIKMEVNVQNQTPFVLIPYYIQRFSKDIKPNLKEYQNLWHQFTFHESTIGLIIDKLSQRWQRLQNKDGYLINYRLSEVETNKKNNFPFPFGGWNN
ncbi:aromatic motif membrane protein [[Mycoplasma] gypis]|uniref:Aromatic motif membrane protein n=1 Tax=[Mycoplasma] gypis TaxID=92404 RepID=A0ABZ2RQJ7_9BACT|nr:aromatic motif membrane protein [[Mycoplasma] gypis]MBN0919493.1 hypothetical protein [[Mycoplasma] gypis]